MNIFSTVRAALLTMQSVTDLVGGSGSDTSAVRIWNTWPRTYTTPCIVIEVDREDETPHLTGQGDLVIGSVVITCRAETESRSHTVQEAVRSGLGAYPETTFSTILESTARSQTPKGDGSTGHWYDSLMDYTMLWTEAV